MKEITKNDEHRFVQWTLAALILVGLVFVISNVSGIKNSADTMLTKGTTSPAAEQPNSRPFYLSFTTYPAGIEYPATTIYSDTDAIYSFIGQHADMMTYHFAGGVPWVEAYDGVPFSQNLQDDWNLRKNSTPANMPLYVAITPLNFGRNRLAEYWGEQQSMDLPGDWATYRFNDPHIKTAYLNYAKRVIEFFKPKYLAIGVESNMLITSSYIANNTNWVDYKELNQYVYTELKQLYPDLVIFSTIQYEDLKRNKILELPEIPSLLQYSDIVALSTYHYGVSDNPPTSNYFDLALSYNKPIAIAESGAMSDTQTVTLFNKTNTYYGSPEDQNQFVSFLLSQSTKYKFLFVVNFFSIDFDKWFVSAGSPEIAKLWVHTGFEDTNYVAKPVLSTWDSYFEIPFGQGGIALPTNGLIGLWKLDEGTGTFATDSVGTNNGTLIGGATWTTGKIGGAVNFDGTSGSINIADNPNLDLQQLTFAFWVKRNGAQSDWAKIINKGSNYGAPYASYKIEFNGNSDDMVYASFGFTDNTNAVAGNKKPLEDGQWNHIAVTYDGTMLKFYLNGIPEGSTNVAGKSIKFDSLPLVIGSGGGFGYFAGAVDDIRIYDRALTDCDVWSIYSEPGLPSSTVTGTVTNTNPINLAGCQNMVIDGANYTMKNNIILHDSAILIIQNSTTFNHASNFSGQYGLNAYDNAKVIIQNSAIQSSPWINWNFHDNATLQMISVANTQSQIWHSFDDNAKATVTGASRFWGTVNKNSSFNLDQVTKTFIETVFPANAIVNENFPQTIGAGAYNFPNSDDTGVTTLLALSNIGSAVWGITYVPQDNITITDTGSLTVTFSIPSTYNGMSATFSGLKRQLYADDTWTTGAATLRLINTTTNPWSPIVAGRNSLTVTDSTLADNTFSSGNATIYIGNSTMKYIRGNDFVNFTISDSVIYGDVVATGNSIINLIGTTVGGQIIQQDNGIVNVRNGSDTVAPTVNITSPTNNTAVSGAAVSINATATDASSITKVEFYVDGGLLNTNTIAPYSASWNTTSYVHNSSHSLVAKAYDSASNVGTSATVTVKVLDVTAPAVSITFPLNNTTVNKNSKVNISAISSDISGIVKVEFYVTGTLKCIDTTVPYSCVWTVPSPPKTTYTLQARAYDVANNVGNSETMRVTSK